MSIDDESKNIFRNFTKDVKTLTKQVDKDSSLNNYKNKSRVKLKATSENSSNLSCDLLPVDVNLVLNENKCGLSHRMFNRFKDGYYRIEASLDLHQLTCQEAEVSLIKFIDKSITKNLLCVLIIHGKGGGFLKSIVRHHLKLNNKVRAFHSATPIDGGTGAVYVLL